MKVPEGMKWSDWLLLGMLGAAFVFALNYIAFGWPAIRSFLADATTASWGQAIGSVGAILAAILIARSSERSAAKYSLINARAFASGLNSAHIAMKGALQLNDFNLVLLINGSLHESLLVGRSVRLELLPSDCIGAVISLRSIASVLNVAVTIYAANPTSDAAKRLHNVVMAYDVNLAASLVELSKAHGDTPAA